MLMNESQWKVCNIKKAAMKYAEASQASFHRDNEKHAWIKTADFQIKLCFPYEILNWKSFCVFLLQTNLVHIMHKFVRS